MNPIDTNPIRKINSKRWYRISYDGEYIIDMPTKNSILDEDEEFQSKIFAGAYFTNRWNYVLKGDVLMTRYPEWTVNGKFINVCNTI
tara:strand:+ start:201 stop:461 length:261 start_codon:yes stop_codon:yes gene_type:complete